VSSTGQTIGFVGLGMMGRPMAARLHAAGHSLAVYDISPEARAAFVSDYPGTVDAAGLDGLAGASVVILMLPNSDVVDATVLGARGLADVLGAGSTIIDMSSSEPLRSQALAKAIAGRGIRFLDAPVSGGVRRAVDGTLAIMCGGDPEVFEAHRSLLAAMGRTITHVGPVGAGHAMKALNNYVSAAGLVATVEALHVGARFGLDPEVMTDVLNSSTGRNNTTEVKVKPFMLSGKFDSGFALRLMAKDLGIAMGLGSAIGEPMRLGEEVLQIWRDAAEKLPASADHTEMYRFLQRD
jgi:3-hydroxyisobutyrate dehydrogenase